MVAIIRVVTYQHGHFTTGIVKLPFKPTCTQSNNMSCWLYDSFCPHNTTQVRDRRIVHLYKNIFLLGDFEVGLRSDNKKEKGSGKRVQKDSVLNRNC